MKYLAAILLICFGISSGLLYHYHSKWQEATVTIGKQEVLLKECDAKQQSKANRIVTLEQQLLAQEKANKAKEIKNEKYAKVLKGKLSAINSSCSLSPSLNGLLRESYKAHFTM